MRHGEDDGIEFFCRNIVCHGQTILVLDMTCIGPRVINGDVLRIFLQSVEDIHDLGVADVGAVFLEGDAEDEDLGVLHHHALLVHAFDGLVGHIRTHAVVQSSG